MNRRDTDEFDGMSFVKGEYERILEKNLPASDLLITNTTWIDRHANSESQSLTQISNLIKTSDIPILKTLSS